MDLKPLADRILVRPEDTDEALPSGLVIPDTAKEKPQEGTVLAVGPGAYDDGKRVPLDVKKATGCCTRSTAAPRSRSRARICSFLMSATFSRS